jgi:hypothetical protein
MHFLSLRLQDLLGLFFVFVFVLALSDALGFGMSLQNFREVAARNLLRHVMRQVSISDVSVRHKFICSSSELCHALDECISFLSPVVHLTTFSALQLVQKFSKVADTLFNFFRQSKLIFLEGHDADYVSN